MRGKEKLRKWRKNREDRGKLQSCLSQPPAIGVSLSLDRCLSLKQRLSFPPFFLSNKSLRSFSLCDRHLAAIVISPISLRSLSLPPVLPRLRSLSSPSCSLSLSATSLKALDSSHVALVALLLRSEGFEHYCCDRNLSMGMNLNNMSKMLKCAGNDDIITIKADDGSNTITFMFESPNQDKIADFEMKLMDIDSEHLGIPKAESIMPL